MFPNMYMSKKGSSSAPDYNKGLGIGERNYLILGENKTFKDSMPFGYSLGRVAISSDSKTKAELIALVKERLKKANLENINFSDLIEKIGEDLINGKLSRSKYTVEFFAEYPEGVNFIGSHWNLDTWSLRYMPEYFWYVIKEENLTPTEELNRAFSDVPDIPIVGDPSKQTEEQTWQ